MDEQSRQTPAPYAAGTGSVPVAPDRAAFDRMGYRERLALKRENPSCIEIALLLIGKEVLDFLIFIRNHTIL